MAKFTPEQYGTGLRTWTSEQVVDTTGDDVHATPLLRLLIQLQGHTLVLPLFIDVCRPEGSLQLTLVVSQFRSRRCDVKSACLHICI